MTSEAPAIRLAERAELRGASRGAVLLTATGLFVSVGNLIFNVMVARVGGAEGYGALGPLLAVAAVAAVLATGVQYALARRVALTAAGPRDGLRLGARAVLPWMIVAVALLVVAPLGAAYLRLSSALPVVLTVALAFSSLLAALPFGVLVGDQRFGLIAVANGATVVLRIAMVPLLRGWMDSTTTALVASLLPVMLISGALIVWLLRRQDSRGSRAGDAARAGTGIGAEGAVGAACACGLWALWSLPLLFARHGMSDAAAGRFAAAQLLCGGVLLLTGAVATAFFPVIASRATHRRQLVVSGLAATTGLVALGVVALVVAGPAVIRALYGAGFDSDRLVLTNLGLSVAVVGIATYAMWAVRAVHVDSLAVVGAVGLAVMLELGFGMAAHHTMTVLALAPAVCILAASGVAGAALWLRGWARRRRLSSSSAASPIPLRGTAGLDFGE